jgi:hypothetical protein
MLISDGYAIEYYRAANRIVINIPQTVETLTSTAAMVSNRRTYLSDEELSALLALVKTFMERKED